METESNIARAFGGLDRLYGAGAIDCLRRSHIVVVGLGGVGSWAVEALARSAVGRLTLIDADHLAESNLNRQLPALHSTLGMLKAQALQSRVADINPTCTVEIIDAFLEPNTINVHLPQRYTAIVDCIDGPRVKAALIAYCRSIEQPIIVCGASGGKTDPTKIQRQDLSACTHDPLLSTLRSELRRRYFFAKKGSMQVHCISSTQPRLGAVRDPSAGAALACAGYGSVVTVTATMGFVAASAAIEIGLKPADA